MTEQTTEDEFNKNSQDLNTEGAGDSSNKKENPHNEEQNERNELRKMGVVEI